MLEGNSLLTEDLPVADALAVLCEAGDEALRYAGAAPPDGWKTRTLAALKEAGGHRANLLIAIALAVQKLVAAAP